MARTTRVGRYDNPYAVAEWNRPLPAGTACEPLILETADRAIANGWLYARGRDTTAVRRRRGAAEGNGRRRPLRPRPLRPARRRRHGVPRRPRGRGFLPPARHRRVPDRRARPRVVRSRARPV